jgi:hypothetical protein
MPLLLLDGKEWAFVEGSIRGNVNWNEALFEYQVSSEGGFTRPEIRHYVVKNRRLERVDPVAVIPRNFVAFWLGLEGAANSRWTESANRSRFNAWSKQNHVGPLAEFDPTLHCKRQPDLWQVATETEKNRWYFLVRWRPPYHFTMVSVSDQPSPDCTERDPEADEPRSLFEPIR